MFISGHLNRLLRTTTPNLNYIFSLRLASHLQRPFSCGRANGFQTFIVSGGGIEFMRSWTEQVYGLPSGQVLGNSIKTKFELRAGPAPRFCLYVHHPDAAREWACDRQSHAGELDKGLNEAQTGGWIVVRMTVDWKTIFPLENK